jgi:hypothetical protein
MLVREVSDKIGLRLLAGADGMDNELKGAYICDLLSWVMSHAKKGDAWITVQTHANIIAAVFQSGMSAYELAKELYKMGIE